MLDPYSLTSRWKPWGAGPGSLWPPASLTDRACGPSPSGPRVGEGDGVREEVLIPGWWGALGGRQVIARACGLLCCLQQQNLGTRAEVRPPARPEMRAYSHLMPGRGDRAPPGTAAPLAGIFPHPCPPPLPISRESGPRAHAGHPWDTFRLSGLHSWSCLTPFPGASQGTCPSHGLA